MTLLHYFHMVHISMIVTFTYIYIYIYVTNVPCLCDSIHFSQVRNASGSQFFPGQHPWRWSCSAGWGGSLNEASPFFFLRHVKTCGHGSKPIVPYLGGWTSIYHLFWCSLGYHGFDPWPCQNSGFSRWTRRLLCDSPRCIDMQCFAGDYPVVKEHNYIWKFIFFWQVNQL